MVNAGCKCKLEHVVTSPCSPLGERLRGIAGPDIKEVQEIHPDLHSVESRSLWLQRKPHFPCTNSFFASSTSELTCNWSQWQLLATLHSNSIIHKLPHSLQTLRPMTTCIFAGHQMSSYFRDTAVFQPLRHRFFGCFLCSCGMCRKNHPNHSAALACTTHYTLKAQQWPSHLWQHRPRPVSWHQITTTHNACCMGYLKYTIFAHWTKSLIWENFRLLICKWT